MGVCLSHQPVFSKGPDLKCSPEVTASRASEWKLFLTSDAARDKYDQDGTLSRGCDESHLELRAVLDEPVAQRNIGKYAKELNSLDIFMCWIDIQEYKSIPTEDYRRSKALHIYHKYVKEGAVLQISNLDHRLVEDLGRQLEKHVADKTEALSLSFFNEIQSKCFEDIHQVDDFVYFEKLGEGGFGVVVHCMKKSTRKHYAMKIQTKESILAAYEGEPWRAMSELNTLSKCQHPFIVNLDYAFQTEGLAVLVLGLAQAGDLSAVLKASPNNRIPPDRVRFYSAQVVLALAYLHQLGLMYRDLKPENILLTTEGYIQLVDMGGARCADEKETQPSVGNVSSVGNLLFNKNECSTDNKLSDSMNHTTDDINSDMRRSNRIDGSRRLSVMGTFGYMAPEMLRLLSRRELQYSSSVDWWSLGITIFKLLTGKRPFSDKKCSDFISLMASASEGFISGKAELECIFQTIKFPEYVPIDARDLISRLLDPNERSRLGSGRHGVANIKAHPFFKSISWDLLEQKHVESPLRPSALERKVTAARTFHEVLQEVRALNNTTIIRLPDDRQQYFAEWSFTSRQTLRVEFGIANEMEQYDKSFKVRQIMGSMN